MNMGSKDYLVDETSLQFNKITQWLDSSTIEGPPPLTSRDIKLLSTFKIRSSTGDFIDTILGRLYLLEGRADLAANVFRDFLTHHPDQLRWNYYATWADMLSGSNNNLMKRWNNVAAWSGHWTIACLLLDIDPTIDSKLNLRDKLINLVRANAAYAPVIRARLALINDTRPSTLQWRLGQGSIEEDMEALRTMLGVAFYVANYVQMAQLLATPLFQRLPIADQQMWQGLHLLYTGQQIQGEAILQKAATQYNYQRAKLILAAYLLKQRKRQYVKDCVNFQSLVALLMPMAL